jgi:hypothetical protein
MLVVVEVHQKEEVMVMRSEAEAESALDAKDRWKARIDLICFCTSLGVAVEAKELWEELALRLALGLEEAAAAIS